MSGYIPDNFIEVFLKILFDEGESVRYERDPDIIEVQSISEARERIDNGRETGMEDRQQAG